MIYYCRFHVNMNSFLSSFLSDAAISLAGTLDLLGKCRIFGDIHILFMQTQGVPRKAGIILYSGDLTLMFPSHMSEPHSIPAIT